MPIFRFRARPRGGARLGPLAFLLTQLGLIAVGRAQGLLAVAPPHAEPRSPDGRWCVHAGAPVVAPALVDRQGRIYVATTEHVHSFDRQGSYRWSFTLSGAVAGPLVLGPREDVLWIGTTDRRVLALSTAGRLWWALDTVAPVLTGLGFDGRGSLLLGAGDRSVYAVSTGGGVRWRVPLGAFPNATPAPAGGGITWVTAGDELLRLQGAWRLRRVPLPEPALGAPLLVPGGVAVVAGSRLLVFDDAGEPRWAREDVAVVARAPDDALVVVSPAGKLTWLDGDGRERAEALLGAPPTAPPAIAQGVAYVPLASGEVWAAYPEAGAVTRWAVSESPLKEVTADAEGGRLIVTVAGGRICSVPLVE